MISFENDYSEGAHPSILEKFIETNMQQEPGYGIDSYTLKAKQAIHDLLECDTAQLEFLTGGTQTNQIVIDTLLRSYEGVISPITGHINSHEAGAIEFGGHKVLALEATDGKLDAITVQDYIQNFYADPGHKHMVVPGMVYISFPTELGTLYSLKELTALSEVCKNYQIPLFIDGARLGYGLMSESCDVSIQDLARLSDVFYIGATKIGALCGEAVIFTKNNKPVHFTSIVKQHGALLAKGRLLGVQFYELFKDNLYFDLSRHALDMALKLKKGFLTNNYKLFADSPTNQQFIIIEDKKLEALSQKFAFTFWEKYDENHTVVRLVTSWATLESNVDLLIDSL